ncbi:hypothetical protein [Tichowtungia aerotolerans]|uniref:VCBS repeat-containing protein n=1 Tax=Tichowtungia aerotolerans TaxID=2697043 RepID=A0A6P1M913_9BACT|nr:hypothetical protein [Tichowtungia aerotolerans]QHI70381.1 hypothetical protein GT409_13330 [Tichowtungia aerotolerans]
MKKVIFEIGLYLICTSSLRAQTLSEQFDWGSGVDGRVIISERQSIGGQAVQAGDVSWLCNIGRAVFCGDFNGDGYWDIGLRNKSTEQIEICFADTEGTLSFGKLQTIDAASSGAEYTVLAVDAL